MAKKCGGPWESKVGEGQDPDGLFVLHVDPDTGEISGHHVVDGHEYPVWGLCRDGLFSGHKIDIWEPRTEDGGYAFHYFGKIKLLQDEDKITEKGKRRRVREPTDTKADKFLAAEDEWVGTQTT